MIGTYLSLVFKIPNLFCIQIEISLRLMQLHYSFLLTLAPTKIFFIVLHQIFYIAIHVEYCVAILFQTGGNIF